MHSSVSTVAAATFFGVGLALPAQPLALRDEAKEWKSDESKSDFNVYVQYSEKRISWGDLRPADAVMKFKDECTGISCGDSATLTLESQFISESSELANGEVVITPDGTFSGNKDMDDLAKLTGLVDLAREALIDLGDYEVRSAAKDGDNGCGPTSHSICQMEEVEAAQYTNVANIAIRVEDKGGNLISNLDISAEPDDGDSSNECGDVADLGSTIAGHFNSFLAGGFQFMGLMCDL